MPRDTLLAAVGGFLVILGASMALRPRTMTAASQDDDGKPLALTQANVLWTRLLGTALLCLGVVLTIAGFVGVRADPDPVGF
jgi:hypothetical protein